ncbi:Butyryl-CoA dehydrogenase [Patulibacter medicamentivorans]|uniref:Butyryl-CoA dehydrogenase n=1 Tax=Patulibacter medicamentivorans TaxID=1097667 RepID=H0E4Q9_9ACTN|nr:acyl-CoA dehydrogenase family protein [Patulibacter medicamentivorans]EHN11337.1 Butyryl-CoA dehydrogenase [Patulibacter medicamentivorans]
MTAPTSRPPAPSHASAGLSNSSATNPATGWEHLFTDEHEQLRASIRGWVDSEIRPHVQAWEDAKWVPGSVFRALGETGFASTWFPTELGGQGGDHLHDAVWTQEIARAGSGGVAAALSAPTTIAAPPIVKFGSEAQRQRWVPPVLRGEQVAALAITEPGTGSDVAGIQTRAEKVDGGFVVNGEKCFITGGVRAQYYVAAVKTSGEGGHGGISFLVIERGEQPEGIEDDPVALGAARGDGISASLIDKLGWHASDTALISFQDVFVPEDHLLGELDGGFKLIMANFQWERLSMALGAVAGMDLAFEQAKAYVAERTAFGRRIADFQGTRWALAEMGTQIEACRALTYETLRRHVAGEQVIQEVSMAKLMTQRALVDVVDRCLQLHGGAGYMKEYGIERAWRDARLGPIGGGTDEIMKDVVGRLMGL